MGYGYGWEKPYVSAAERHRRAAEKSVTLKKSGRSMSPVEIKGLKIAKTFWGMSWCKNLEAYSDYSNRLPRGRTYARNGSVIDLQIEAGRVRAMVSGSDFYDIEIKIARLPKKHWGGVKTRCAGKIDSVVELLQGSISDGVMAVVTDSAEGLFPSPKDISLSCSCPDWASMCKHVAAALYGVGARLDHAPELLFTLRGVDPAELVTEAVEVSTRKKTGRGRVLQADDMASVFGIDLDMSPSLEDGTGPSKKLKLKKAAPKKKAASKKKAAPKKAAPKKKKVATRVVSKKAVPKKAVPKKAVPKKATAKKAVPKKATSKKKAVPKKAVPKKAVPKKATAKKVATKAGPKKKAAAKKAVPKRKKAATKARGSSKRS